MSIFAEFTVPQESFIRLSEADSIRAAQKGDLEAFNQLVLFHQEKIFNLALRILGDEDSAEDITQNTFLAAFRSLPRFRNGSFRTWLYRIATNACIDEIRRYKKNPVLFLEDEDGMDEKLMPYYSIAGLTISPEKEYERHELEKDILYALNQLDTSHRTIVVMVDLLEFDYKEAAQILGIPTGTVKSRLARARLRLSGLMGSYVPSADANRNL